MAATIKEDKYSGLAADYFFSLLAQKITNVRATSRRLLFCYSTFLCSSSDITAFCCTILLFARTAQRNGYSYNFLSSVNLNSKIPRDPIYRVSKNKINNSSRSSNNMVWYGMQRQAPFFQPLQLGVGMPGGCEAAIHVARRYL